MSLCRSARSSAATAFGSDLASGDNQHKNIAALGVSARLCQHLATNCADIVFGSTLLFIGVAASFSNVIRIAGGMSTRFG